MKRLLSILAAILFSATIYNQPNNTHQPVNNGYPKARIVTGCLISAVGIALLIESVRPAPGVPFFNPTEEQIKRQHTKFNNRSNAGWLVFDHRNDHNGLWYSPAEKTKIKCCGYQQWDRSDLQIISTRDQIVYS